MSWATVVMVKLRKLDWRFSLNDQGRLIVRVGRPDDKVRTDIMMALLGEWARHCEHVLLSRGP